MVHLLAQSGLKAKISGQVKAKVSGIISNSFHKQILPKIAELEKVMLETNRMHVPNIHWRGKFRPMIKDLFE